MADLHRPLPGGEAEFPALLTLPAPRIGLFWTAGNPGALPRELDDSRVEFSFGYTGVEGAYRRPMDPGATRRGQIAGFAWGPLGSRGAAVGRVVGDRTTLDEGAHADVAFPYSTSPLAALDSLGDPQRRSAARLEGAGGWRLGPLGLGLGLGFESEELRTVESPVPRNSRLATAGVAGGASWDLGGEGLRIGAFGRWRQSAQTVAIFTRAATSRVYEFIGYDDPVPLDLDRTFYNRRLESEAWAAGAGAAGRAGALRWTAFLQREGFGEERFDPRENEPLVDRWEADGWTAGAAAQLTAPGPGLLFTLDARFTTLEGTLDRKDLEEPAFTAEHRALHLSGEIRSRPPESGPGWEWAARGGLVGLFRTADDFIVRTGTELDGWTPEGAIEVARHFGDRFALALGGAASAYAPTSTLPDPADLGPVYARWIHPALALEATGAFGWAASLTARLRPSPGVAVWLGGRFGSAAAVDPLSDVPGESRRGGTAELGVVLGG